MPTTHVIVGSIPQIGAVRTTSASSRSTPTLPDVVGERIDDGEPVSYVDINTVIEP